MTNCLLFTALWMAGIQGQAIPGVNSPDPTNAVLPPGSPPGAYNLLAYSQLVQARKCPGYENRTDCYYPGTPLTGPVTWRCPAGSFCVGPGSVNNCTLGFYCPADSIQASYCPKKYYCPNTTTIRICPAWKYCPRGTVQPQSCLFGYCPEGSDSANRFGVGGVFVLFAVAVFAFFNWKDKADKERALKRKLQFQNSAEQALLHEKPQLAQLERTFDIEFDNLGLVLPNGVEIMGNVTGALRAGRTTAIMGPSGAGKTTFVTLLTGKVQRTSGSVRINGQMDELSRYKKLIGYVPQEDVMLRELTVYDILMHSARMRLPENWDYRRIKAKVIEIISFLGLTHVAQSVIGDEETRGISGGQRKRVNIGMELVAEPSVLFLDEPTSGLDSSTSFEVCSNLRNIARQQGLTVAAVIHSPSPATFKQFDDFILLGKGGHLVYMGPREECLKYFDSIGFTCPADESPSDFYMDVVTGKIASAFDPAFEPKHLFKYWEMHTAGQQPFANKRRLTPQEADAARLAHVQAKHAPKMVYANIHATGNADAEGVPAPPPLPEPQKKFDLETSKDYIISGTLALGREWGAFFWDVLQELWASVVGFYNFVTGTKDEVRNTCPFYMQLYLLMKRASKQVLRTPGSIVMELLVHFASGTFISIAVQNFDFLGASPREQCGGTPWNIGWQCTNTLDNLREAGMFISLGTMFAGISNGANTFGREKVVYWRDTASGMNTIPYYLAKFLVDAPRVILGGTMYSIALILIFPYRQTFIGIYSIVICLYFVAFGMGYWISTAFPLQRAPLLGVGFALLWALVLSGVLPSLDDVYGENFPTALQFLWDLSAPRWAIEAFWIKEVEARPFIEKNRTQADHKYEWDNYTNDFKYMIYIAIVWNLLAFLGLKLFNRSKQK